MVDQADGEAVDKGAEEEERMDRLGEVDDNLGSDEAKYCVDADHCQGIKTANTSRGRAARLPGLKSPQPALHVPEGASTSWPGLRLSVPMAQQSSEPTGPCLPVNPTSREGPGGLAGELARSRETRP
ncbi:hypothetical protein DHEL01_v203915 [Diaporthe helianthi]|uniref:Uncharacterized protein n=1 Tax=Diaporthe helianthi TaxID=158607 RepID=A0A2P5I589_DIAHE|nr:hypothetical protein DHEL01_v203915 [Diaporthe helianthi]